MDLIGQAIMSSAIPNFLSIYGWSNPLNVETWRIAINPKNIPRCGVVGWPKDRVRAFPNPGQTRKGGRQGVRH